MRDKEATQSILASPPLLEVVAATVKDPPCIVLVMGPTGAGKSKLVQTATGDTSVEVGDSLRSCTKEPNPYKIPDTNIYLLDTPGFDDTFVSAVDILDRIGASLLILGTTYKISGILYLHSIIEPRMTRSALKNLRLFKKIVGAKNLSKCCLVTTKWSKETTALTESRETELQTDKQFWQPLLKKGAHMVRFGDTKQSVLDTLEIVGADSGSEFTPKLVEELKKGVPLAETAAGKEVDDNIEKVKSTRTLELAGLKEEYAEAIEEDDVEMADDISKQQAEYEKEIRDAEQAREALRDGLKKDTFFKQANNLQGYVQLSQAQAALVALPLVAGWLAGEGVASVADMVGAAGVASFARDLSHGLRDVASGLISKGLKFF
ncbi:hypothetical protein ABW21_db0209009 [Orbilia brochopaga]|nr:hypothetical protein ABW21_db0209009 [Drechslerella brochopaga]